METWLRCIVQTGQFPSEFAVIVKSFAGREFSLFAQDSTVRFQEPPGENNQVEGLLRVDVIKREGGRCLVRLPRTTLENGSFLSVCSSQLEEAQTALARVG